MGYTIYKSFKGVESLAFLAALRVKLKKTVLLEGYWRPLNKIKQNPAAPGY